MPEGLETLLDTNTNGLDSLNVETSPGLASLMDGFSEGGKVNEEVGEPETNVEDTVDLRKGIEEFQAKKEVEKPVEIEEKPVEVEEPEVKETSSKEDTLWKDIEISDVDKALISAQSSKKVRQLIAGKLREFNGVKKELSNLRGELEGERIKDKGASFYDNPEAWQLLPEANQLTSKIQSNVAWYKHWKEQAISAEEGGDVYDAQMDKDGKITYSKNPIKSSGAIKTDIAEILHQSKYEDSKLRGKFEQLREGHIAKSSQVKVRIEDTRKKTFGHWQNETVKVVRSSVEKLLEDGGIGRWNPAFDLMADMVLEIAHYRDTIEKSKTNGKPNGSSPKSIKSEPRSRDSQAAPSEEKLNRIGQFLKGDASEF